MATAAANPQSPKELFEHARSLYERGDLEQALVALRHCEQRLERPAARIESLRLTILAEQGTDPHAIRRSFTSLADLLPPHRPPESFGFIQQIDDAIKNSNGVVARAQESLDSIRQIDRSSHSLPARIDVKQQYVEWLEQHRTAAEANQVEARVLQLDEQISRLKRLERAENAYQQIVMGTTASPTTLEDALRRVNRWDAFISQHGSVARGAEANVNLTTARSAYHRMLRADLSKRAQKAWKEARYQRRRANGNIVVGSVLTVGAAAAAGLGFGVAQAKRWDLAEVDTYIGTGLIIAGIGSFPLVSLKQFKRASDRGEAAKRLTSKARSFEERVEAVPP